MKHPLFQLALTIAIRMAFLWACLLAFFSHWASLEISIPTPFVGVVFGSTIDDRVFIELTAVRDGYVCVRNHGIGSDVSRIWYTDPVYARVLTRNIWVHHVDIGFLKVISMWRIRTQDEWVYTFFGVSHWPSITFFTSLMIGHILWRRRWLHGEQSVSDERATPLNRKTCSTISCPAL